LLGFETEAELSISREVKPPVKIFLCISRCLTGSLKASRARALARGILPSRSEARMSSGKFNSRMVLATTSRDLPTFSAISFELNQNLLKEMEK